MLIEKRWFRILIGLLALVATVAVASYQRRTGPTWPIAVEATLDGASVSGELIRTQPGAADARVALAVSSQDIAGEVLWRRYPTQEAWRPLAMKRSGEELFALLPNQPPAAKLEYSVRLRHGDRELVLPRGEAAVIRFRGEVPAAVLILHVLVMFVTLWIVFRAALGVLFGDKAAGRFIPWIVGFLVAGGFLLGPLVQYYAFDAWWTGWPFGGDWTDNKTLAALVAWLVAWAVNSRRPRLQRASVLMATLIMIVVYLIPHSIRGSELDWSQAEDAGAALSDPASES